MRQTRTRVIDTGPWQVPPPASPQKIRWGAVFAGTVLGLALLALLSTLWFALAYASNVEEVRANLEWYVGASAIACLFFGGLLSGWLSGVRGAAAGLFNGMAIWAMVLVLTLLIGVPSIMDVFNLGRVTQLADGTTTTQVSVDMALWATFWSILGGLIACALGGAIGGAVTTPANADLALTGTEHRDQEVDEVDVERGDDHVHDVDTGRQRVS